MTLYVPPSNPKTDLWEGRCCGPERAPSLFGADEAHSNTLLPSFLPGYLRKDNVFASLPPSPSPSPSSQPFHPPSPRKRSSLLKLFSPSEGAAGSSSIGGPNDPPHLMIAAALTGERAKPLQVEVQRLRTLKSEREIRVMKAAADLSSAAHARVSITRARGLVPANRLTLGDAGDAAGYVRGAGTGDIRIPLRDGRL